MNFRVHKMSSIKVAEFGLVLGDGVDSGRSDVK